MRVHRAGREQRGERSYRCRIAGAAEVPRVLVQRTLAGSGTLHLDGRRHAVPPGHALVVAIPGPATWCYEGDGPPWRFAFVSIACPEPPVLTARPVIPMPEGGVLERLHTALVDARVGGDFGHQAVLAYQLLLGVAGAVRGAGASGSEARLAERIAAAGGDCGIAGLARQLGRSHAGLTRRFTRRYGEPPRAFAERLRLRTACMRLAAGSTAAAAAAAAGYADPAHFGRAFRRRLGLAPARWAGMPDEMRIWP